MQLIEGTITGEVEKVIDLLWGQNLDPHSVCELQDTVEHLL